MYYMPGHILLKNTDSILLSYLDLLSWQPKQRHRCFVPDYSSQGQSSGVTQMHIGECDIKLSSLWQLGRQYLLTNDFFMMMLCIATHTYINNSEG